MRMSETQQVMLRRALWVAAPLACLGVLSSVGAVLAADQSSRIAPGTAVAGVAIGDLDPAAAAARLEAALAPRLSRPLTLVAGSRQARVDTRALRGHIPTTTVARQALARSGQGGLVTQLVRSLGTGPGVAVDLPLQLSRPAMDRAVAQAADRLTVPGRSARLEFSASGRPRIIPATDGTGPTPSAVRVGIRQGILAEGATVRLKEVLVDAELTTAEAQSRYRTLIVVDRSRQRLTLWRNLRRVKTYRTSTARAPYVTPPGEFLIADKQRNPTWNVPNSPWAGELAGQVIPPGPSNPLRERWMGLADGIGIHGTSDVGNLGSPASHGCIRMSPADVIDLFDRVAIGTPVIVR